MDRVLGGLMVILVPAFFILTIVAFYKGMNVWLGWGFWASFAVMVVAMALRDIGGLFMSVVAFVGMWKGWELQFLVALALAFPMVAFMIATMLGGGVVKVLTRRSAH